jgi:prepilin-type processing-associated H-X9-DG protein
MPTSDPLLIAKSDYAINGGWWPFANCSEPFGGAGPASLQMGDNWPTGDPTVGWDSAQYGAEGIGFQRSEVKMAWITDGSSNTIFCGEKYVNPDFYNTNQDWMNMYCGCSQGAMRTCWVPPLRDTPGYPYWFWFGSPHASGANFSMCDGSVRPISYGVDPQTFANLGNRHDGCPIDPTKL